MPTWNGWRAAGWLRARWSRSPPADDEQRVRQIKRLAGRIGANDAGLFWHFGRPSDGNIYLIVAPEGTKSVGWFGELKR